MNDNANVIFNFNYTKRTRSALRRAELRRTRLRATSHVRHRIGTVVYETLRMRRPNDGALFTRYIYRRRPSFVRRSETGVKPPGDPRGVTTTPNAVSRRLSLALLLRLELLAQNGRDLALHERPRHRRIRQRTLLSTGTIHLGALLALDRLPAAGEAELVMQLRRTLHEVCVLETLLTQSALEQRLRGAVGGLPRLRGRHRRGAGHVPRARRTTAAARP